MPVQIEAQRFGIEGNRALNILDLVSDAPESYYEGLLRCRAHHALLDERFIRGHRLDLYAMAELCARYGISRKTGYKWLGRFEEGGRLGLHDRSRAPHDCPHRITRDVAAVICAARRQHPSWGPAKLLAWLQPRHPDFTVADQHTRFG